MRKGVLLLVILTYVHRPVGLQRGRTFTLSTSDKPKCDH
jgi:hypothetical protein